MSGSAIATKSMEPTCKVIGVEPELSDGDGLPATGAAVLLSKKEGGAGPGDLVVQTPPALFARRAITLAEIEKNLLRRLPQKFCEIFGIV